MRNSALIYFALAAGAIWQAERWPSQRSSDAAPMALRSLSLTGECI